MAHEHEPSQSSEAADAASGGTEGLGPNGADVDPLAGLPGVDDETAALLRSLEMPGEGGDAPSDAPVPLSGVLKRTKKRPRPVVAASEEPTLQDTEATVPDVIAYEPIQIDAGWGDESDDATVADMDIVGGGSQDTQLMDVHTGGLPDPVGDLDDDVEELDDDAVEEISPNRILPPTKKAVVRPGTQPVPPPPLPPPPPPPRLKEGELILTETELDEMLPGGINDQARDLSPTVKDAGAWYREIFTEDFFRTLPKNFHRQTVREAEFIIKRIGVQPGARLLDLCCGFGRHTMELAKRRFEMVGLDLAMPLLQKALNEAQRRSLSIKFVHGDMRELNFQGVFDGIFNVQTSFGFFDDRTNFKVLQGIKRALKPGGRFLVETIHRDFVCEELPMRIWWEGTECLILEEVDFDYTSSTLRVKRSFVFEDASRDPWEQNIVVRLYSVHELSNMLQRAGLEVIEHSGDYTYPGRFFGSASRRMILVAERPV